jgi:molybdenum cofactor cytidylyltransferase
LSDLQVEFVVNREFREGIAASVRAGASAVDSHAEAIVFCLGDMPLVSTEVIDRLIAAFDPSLGLAAWQAAFQGRPGNPVLWSAKYLEELRTLHGDEGARSLLRRHANLVATVQMDSSGVLTDIDTPDDLSAALGKRQPSDVLPGRDRRGRRL